MPTQKRGFWLFIFSLIPGAGEMYMGFFKQGISIMTLFWGIVAISGGMNLDFTVVFLPVIWFYSFFHVHNLKNLPPEEFYTVEDNYIFHIDQFFRETDKLIKNRKPLAICIIIFGAAILWNSLTEMVFCIIPNEWLSWYIQDLMSHIPPLIIAIFIIWFGICLLTGKLPKDSPKEKRPGVKSSEEHYWQPYRPYQQPKEQPTAPFTQAVTYEQKTEQEAQETSYEELKKPSISPITDEAPTDSSSEEKL